MANIEFRSCLPGDVKDAIPLILSSGPDAFDYVFKNKRSSPTGFLTYAFQSPGGEFSFDNHYAILKDGKVIGIGAIFSSKRAKGFTIMDAYKIIRFYKWNALSVIIRGLKIEQVLKLPKKDEVCLAHLGVAPAERSNGYGQQLIEYLMQQVETNPNTTFVLDVSEENPRAKSLYEKMGFVVRKHVPSRLKSKYGFVVGHFRMGKG